MHDNDFSSRLKTHSKLRTTVLFYVLNELRDEIEISDHSDETLYFPVALFIALYKVF